MNSGAKPIRPTKKQTELLAFISNFIDQHGYSPSYREIMSGLNYHSVATVALHVQSLIDRGQIVKRGRSARSLEIVNKASTKISSNQIKPDQEKWLVEKVEHAFSQTEQAAELSQAEFDNLRVLVDALRVLGLEGAAASFVPRLHALAERSVAPGSQ